MDCYIEKKEQFAVENSKAKNDINNELNKRKKKFTGGNASKRHRDRVNVEFNNLAKLLPFPESVIAKLDKSSILRLTVSFIQAKSFFKDAPKNVIVKQEESTTPSAQIKEGTGIVTEMFSQALDGFLLVLTEDMKVLFVSESVRDYLGYCQAGIIHENFLQFVNPADHSVVQSNMNYRANELNGFENNSSDSYDSLSPNQSKEQLIMRSLETRGQTTLGSVPRRFICRMKCAYSCSSRFYTAYRTFQFSGRLRKCTIHEGREQKTFNTLVVFATPIMSNTANTNSGSTALNSETTATPMKCENVKLSEKIGLQKELNEKNLYAYERYTTGFRIEPTLRPHVAPIPVSSKDQTFEPQFTSTAKPPSLISTSEIYAREVPRLINRNRVPSYAKSSRNETASIDSRYSDHSDDSKCSPASSPNLIWKQRKSPIFVPYEHRSSKPLHYYNSEADLRYARKSTLVAESDILWRDIRPSPEMLHKFEREEQLHSNSKDSYLDMYTRGMSTIKMRRDSGSPVSPLYAPEPIVEHRKRYIEYYPEDVERVIKRPKLEPKKNFHISSLLDLEEKSEATQHRKTPIRRSAFTELIAGSYLSPGTRYYTRKGGYIPI